MERLPSAAGTLAIGYLINSALAAATGADIDVPAFRSSAQSGSVALLFSDLAATE